MPKFNRTKSNFYIDLAMLIVLAALIGVGILIKFILIPGQERWLVFGQNTELTFLGLNRHEWGTIHLITGIVFFVLFIFHILFHWNMIKCMFQKCIPSKLLRVEVVSVSLFLFTGLIVFPFFVQPQESAVRRGEGRINLEGMDIDLNDSIRVKLKKPKKLEGSGEPELEYQRKASSDRAGEGQTLKEVDINGKMTLYEVAEKYNYPISNLKEKLGIPPRVSEHSKLGHLKKRYDFRMSEVKRIMEVDPEKKKK